MLAHVRSRGASPGPNRREPGAPLLAAHFLRGASRGHRLPTPRLEQATLAVLAVHPWPGNVREFAHALEAALILSGTEGGGEGLARALQQVLGARAGDELTTERAAGAGPMDGAPRHSFYRSDAEERTRIRAALARCRGNRTRVARELGMSRNTMRDQIRRYGF